MANNLFIQAVSTVAYIPESQRVNLYANLPADPSLYVGQIWYVENDTKLLFITTKPSGCYYSNGTAWKSSFNIIPYFDDSIFQIYNSVDSNKIMKISTASITSGQTRTLTMANKDIDLGEMDNRFRKTATVTSAELLTGVNNDVIYVDEKEAFYKYSTSCTIPRDADLILNTGNAGNTRWQLIQKVSRSLGDTGWVNTDNATLSKVSTNIVRLNISTPAVISVMSKRIELPIGNYDYTVSGAGGLRYLYFDDATLTVKSRTTLWDFNKEVPFAIAYWSASAIVGIQTEFHGIRDNVWHYWAHTYLGCQYKSGLTFTGNVQTDNNTDPNIDTCQYLWATDGIIQDEDAVITPGIGKWLQTLGSGLTSTTAMICNFWYYNGTVIAKMNAMADRTPFIHAGGNTTPQWNNGGTLTAAIIGDYIVYHYFASPMIEGDSVYARPHNAKFTSLALATAARPSDLTWTETQELKHLYSAIFRVNTTWAPVPTHACKMVALNDFRKVTASPTSGSPATDHNALSNRTVIGGHSVNAIYGTANNRIPYYNSTTGGMLDDAVLQFDHDNKRLSVNCALQSNAKIGARRGSSNEAVLNLQMDSEREVRYFIGVASTSNATPFYLDTVIPFSYPITIIANVHAISDSDYNCASYELMALVEVSVPSIVGTQTKRIIGETAAGLDAYIELDTSLQPRIKVVGLAGVELYWMAEIKVLYSGTR